MCLAKGVWKVIDRAVHGLAVPLPPPAFTNPASPTMRVRMLACCGSTKEVHYFFTVAQGRASNGSQKAGNSDRPVQPGSMAPTGALKSSVYMTPSVATGVSQSLKVQGTAPGLRRVCTGEEQFHTAPCGVRCMMVSAPPRHPQRRAITLRRALNVLETPPSQACILRRRRVPPSYPEKALPQS